MDGLRQKTISRYYFRRLASSVISNFFEKIFEREKLQFVLSRPEYIWFFPKFCPFKIIMHCWTCTFDSGNSYAYSENTLQVLDLNVGEYAKNI